MLYFDVRFKENCGIGTYISLILPTLPKSTTLIVEKQRDLPFSQVVVSTKPFSIFEPFEWNKKIPKQATVWLPHIHVPRGFRPNRLIVTIHDFFYHDMLPPWSIKRVVAEGYYRRACLADRIITISETMYKKVLQRGVEGRIDWIHHGIALYSGKREPQEYFLIIGSRKAHKNIERSIRAFSRYRAFGGRYRLKILVSEGNGGIIYDSRGIEWISQIDSSRKMEMIQGAAALIMPSLYEGFGYPIIEAMAVATPVIASDIPIFREIARGGAYFIDPYKEEELIVAMDRIEKETGFSQRLSEAAKKRASYFSIEKMYNKYKQIYLEELLCEGNDTLRS